LINAHAILESNRQFLADKRKKRIAPLCVQTQPKQGDRWTPSSHSMKWLH
jgi:hypothetical protein